jgi:acyl carrier protein
LPGPSPTAERTAELDPYTHDVLDVVRDMLVDVIGPEYLIDLTVGLDTAFDRDLELESLEFVALAERLLQHYGGQVDFVAWLATMELDEIIGLSVGDLVAFIVASTAGEPLPEPLPEPGTAAAGPATAGEPAF